MQQDMVEQTLAIIASMMQQAAHDATLYCAEAKRTIVMPRDIELALKRLVLLCSVAARAGPSTCAVWATRRCRG
jgi:hypothetical protein